jgi:hypothetical protein
MTKDELPTISPYPEIQESYVRMRRGGQSHNMAEMLAVRIPSGTRNTDRAFLEGRHSSYGLEATKMPEDYIRIAKQAGVNPHGKVYVSQLASKRGDPRAWVSSLGEVGDRCRESGRGCSALGIKAPEPPPTQQIRLAEDIVQEEMGKALVKNPGKATKLSELRREVIEKHGSPPKESFNMKAAKD